MPNLKLKLWNKLVCCGASPRNLTDYGLIRTISRLDYSPFPKCAAL